MIDPSALRDQLPARRWFGGKGRAIAGVEMIGEAVFEDGPPALAGGLALGIMMIPIIARTTEELLLLVPSAMREGALALGATRARAVFTVIVPSALPGIITGIVLALAIVAALHRWAAGRVVSRALAAIDTPGWIAMAKRSLVTLLPRYNTARMLNEYLARLYVPAATQARRYQKDRFENAREVATWRAKVSAAWKYVVTIATARYNSTTNT